MERMIEYIDKLKKIDTEGVEPMAYIFENRENVFREDIVTNGNTKDHIVKNAPEEEKGMIIVPKTV